MQMQEIKIERSDTDSYVEPSKWALRSELRQKVQNLIAQDVFNIYIPECFIDDIVRLGPELDEHGYKVFLKNLPKSTATAEFFLKRGKRDVNRESSCATKE